MLTSILVTVVTFGCVRQERPDPPSVDPLARYREAVADAAVAEPDEQSGDLVALTPQNPGLQWREDGRFLAATWTSWPGYDDHVGQETALQREVWVTAAPGMQRACSRWGLHGAALALRMEQLLGLPPGGGKDRVVALWVSPADVFRPCPDPEVGDSSCALEFPVSERFVTVSAAHRAWFADLQARSYGEGGYPWTRLGYTYDWGPGGEVGLSEFVIAPGSIVEVQAVTPQDAYCASR